ncbi:MAG TPA: phosphatase PAP2 family protein [Polyangiales bacterium]|nr:phosphatase PAP2 family protein [Polyangiales bacterium]
MLIALVSASAHAQTAVLPYDLRVDIPVTAAAVTWVVVSQLAKAELAPLDARWCDCHSDGSDALNGLDSAARSAFRWNDTGTANTLGDVVGYAVAPVVALGSIAWAAHHDDVLRNFPIDALLIVEAVMLAEAVVQLVKPLAGRERPFVHGLSEAEKPLTADPLDNNVSFYSSHTSWTFALASAAGTVATLRRYRFAPWVWAAGLTLATFVGYTRIAADQHYSTDVLTGAVMGAGIGFAIPYFFHRAFDGEGPKVSVAGSPRGAYLAVSWSE